MGRRDDEGRRQAPKRTAKSADREDRRAAALRANLRRRKAQSRARTDRNGDSDRGARRGED